MVLCTVPSMGARHNCALIGYTAIAVWVISVALAIWSSTAYGAVGVNAFHSQSSLASKDLPPF